VIDTVLVTVEFENLKKHCEWFNIGNYCGLTHEQCNYQNCPLVNTEEKVNKRIEEIESESDGEKSL
jgi:hypothetical protein